jgi:hypothetical protein
MCLQAIPFTAIVEYFRIYESGDLDDFIYVIRSMDNVFLELNDKESEKGKNSAASNADKKNPNKVRHTK